MPVKFSSANLPELPDKPEILPCAVSANYTLRVRQKTREQIEIINSVKIGLTDQIRLAIEAVVDVYWKKLYPDQDETLK